MLPNFMSLIAVVIVWLSASIQDSQTIDIIYVQHRGDTPFITNKVL